MQRRMRIGIQMMWMNGTGLQNHIGDHGVADAWAKYLRRRDDIESVEVFGGGRMQNDCDVLINFHPGLPTHARAKNILYSQNAWSEEQHPGGTVGVFNAVKDRYQGYLFPSEKLRQLCGGEGAVIPFAADPERFYYQPDPRFEHPVCFVGNDIRGPEVNEAYLIPAIPHGLVIYGGPYSDPRLQAVHRGRLSEEDLPKAYSSARVNLNLTIPEHAKNGVINSRIYEILACGGVIVTDVGVACDDLHGRRELFVDAESLAWLGGTMCDNDWREKHRTLSRDAILANHTWEHRMSDLMVYLKGIL